MRRVFPILLVVLLLCGCGAAKTWQEEYDLGVRYLSEGNYDEAILAFEAAIEIDPKAPGAYLALANAYVGQGDYENAGSVLTRALESVEDPAAIQARLTILEGEQDGEAFPGVRAEASYASEGALKQIDWFDASGVLIRTDHYYPYLGFCYQIEWFDAAGEVIRKEDYNDDGSLHQLEWYDEDGNFVRDHYDSETGYLTTRETTYVAGEFDHSIHSYDANGELFTVDYWNDDHGVSRRDFYEGGVFVRTERYG